MPKTIVHYFPNQGDVLPDFLVGSPIVVGGYTAEIIEVKPGNKLRIKYLHNDKEVHTIHYRIHNKKMPEPGEEE